MKRKTVFIEGAITPEFIATSIAKHQGKTSIGAHNIFLGQVREDSIDSRKVTAIDFSCYQEMAEKKLAEIRETTFQKYELTCMHIYHSLGEVSVGGICIFVFVSAPHRPIVYEATEYIVNEVKTKVPIFGKELIEGETHQWKKNN
ncbi:molybdenum cofactor biosynthesis protein MoaE [Aquimarina sp. U1-2]|uniref:molybdenum cofactor biosynthesis protein MoaE n=1 Tax=Aquimarina sp. U1-2 TaxID=2823141 RepID=UPI001AECB3F1|nr:molybdenum cofactor biosynthesis protein MoaE [Aquimarina sp. U1-2]MBP2833793.1 molybdenum cofactor biosynthesis protein MoaE [Aquimarina sp. U1-2]